MKWHENNLEMAFTSICVKGEMEAHASSLSKQKPYHSLSARGQVILDWR